MTDLPEDEAHTELIRRLTLLRRALTLSLVAVVPGAVLGWVQAPALLNLILYPYSAAYRHLGLGSPTIHLRNPADQLTAYMQLSLLSGLTLALPVIAFQASQFINPGRRPPHKVLSLVVAACLFFCAGTLFGFYIVFPLIFETILAMTGSIGDVTVSPTIMVGEYVGFAVQMLLAFGAAFEVPVAVVGACLAGLADYRMFLRFGRWWILASSIIAAILTPPDVTSQMLLLVPMVALYYLGVGAAYALARFDDSNPTN